MIHRVAAIVATAALIDATQARGELRFVPLGKLPTTSQGSQASAISADGAVVVGSHSGAQAFRWTQATGMTYLGDGPGGTETRYANAISGDGTVIVGTYGGGGVSKPFEWTQTSGVVAISPRLQPPVAVSYDGSVITGGVNLDLNDGYVEDASWDGNIIVGFAYSEAYLEKNGVRTWLGDLPGGDFESEAYGISPDGEVVVGTSRSETIVSGQVVATSPAFRWTEATGMEALGPWPTGTADDINVGKIVIVGRGNATTTSDTEAFRWTPAKGMESIKQLLLDGGVTAVSNWKLSDAVAVAANGRIIAGWGNNPQGNLEAWLVELSTPGDFNGNGFAEGDDFLIWQSGFGSTHEIEDYFDWKANYTWTPRGQSASAVPEPAASVLLGTLALATAFSSARL